ncbi:helix-turn-helix transcriptional regulator [Paenibacillus sp. LHD-38]|uniref:helix-turn-helix domain-containing protein n=1 Tax=Paenibacillus sp. LHD-38 TaxID=3072143 RepID=UPI00280FF202|nr:helix-turn-helix transcriptional regulator [Paenibacillus sp. LHD-38]MDQ8734237.1 helix-turn-helix transcriptional regulator [Paenibacillus sp. LHD-38]
MNGILEKVGLRIREVRLHKGLTQEKIGEIVGVSYSYIGRIERGQKNISLGMLEKIANALNVNESQFFTYSNEAELVTEKDKQIKAIIAALYNQDARSIYKAKHILFEALKQFNE